MGAKQSVSTPPEKWLTAREMKLDEGIHNPFVRQDTLDLEIVLSLPEIDEKIGELFDKGLAFISRYLYACSDEKYHRDRQCGLWNDIKTAPGSYHVAYYFYYKDKSIRERYDQLLQERAVAVFGNKSISNAPLESLPESPLESPKNTSKVVISDTNEQEEDFK